MMQEGDEVLINLPRTVIDGRTGTITGSIPESVKNRRVLEQLWTIELREVTGDRGDPSVIAEVSLPASALVVL